MVRTKKKYNVLVADDHSVVRDGVKRIIASIAVVDRVGGAGSGKEVLSLCKRRKWDLVIMDIDMPELDGLKALAQLQDFDHPPKVILLSMHCDTHFINRAYHLGAMGYLLKECTGTELKAAVGDVFNGTRSFSEPVKDVLFRDLIEHNKGLTPEQAKLTLKEIKVLQLLCDQLTSREIADKLGLTEETIKTYRRILLKKTESSNMIGLALYAFKNGLYRGVV